MCQAAGGPGTGCRISLRSTPAQRQPFVPSFETTRPRSAYEVRRRPEDDDSGRCGDAVLSALTTVRLTAWRPLSRWLEPPRQDVGRCMIDARLVKRMQARYPKRKTHNRLTRSPAPRFPKYSFDKTPQTQRYSSAATARRQQRKREACSSRA